jgi:hypothetical protein
MHPRTTPDPLRRLGEHGRTDITALERRLNELEQLATLQARELKIRFERIAQLQGRVGHPADPLHQILSQSGRPNPSFGPAAASRARELLPVRQASPLVAFQLDGSGVVAAGS